MRKVFFSFDWDDVWRANVVRYSRITKDSCEAAGFIDVADIEGVKKKTSQAIKIWIDQQLKGTSVTCVLIGSRTADSKWVKYEIEESIKKGNGLLGVYIHNISVPRVFSQKDLNGCTPPPRGENPITVPCLCYDWSDGCGYHNLGHWIELTAKQAGR